MSRIPPQKLHFQPVIHRNRPKQTQPASRLAATFLLALLPACGRGFAKAIGKDTHPTRPIAENLESGLAEFYVEFTAKMAQIVEPTNPALAQQMVIEYSLLLAAISGADGEVVADLNTHRDYPYDTNDWARLAAAVFRTELGRALRNIGQRLIDVENAPYEYPGTSQPNLARYIPLVEDFFNTFDQRLQHFLTLDPITQLPRTSNEQGLIGTVFFTETNNLATFVQSHNMFPPGEEGN